VKGGRVSPHRIASYRIVSRRSAAQRITTYHPPAKRQHAHHPTLPRAPYPTPPCRWPLDPRRRADSPDGRTAPPKTEASTLSYPRGKSRARAAPPHDTPSSSSLQRNPARESTAWAQNDSTAHCAHHITSPQPITQSINQSINKLHIQCIHCHIPSTHPSSAVHIVRTLRLCDVMRCKLQFSMV
jgi:hypothetical protein